MADPKYRAKVNAKQQEYVNKYKKNPLWVANQKARSQKYKNKMKNNPIYKEKLRLKGAAYNRKKTMLKNQQALFAIKLELDRQSTKDKD